MTALWLVVVLAACATAVTAGYALWVANWSDEKRAHQEERRRDAERHWTVKHSFGDEPYPETEAVGCTAFFVAAAIFTIVQFARLSP